MTTILTRTELTQYETEKLHQVKLQVREHSLAVGAYMTRYGTQEVLAEAAELFFTLTDLLVSDPDVRIGALEYGMESSKWGMRDVVASQAYQLRSAFLKDLYSNAVAERSN